MTNLELCTRTGFARTTYAEVVANPILRDDSRSSTSRTSSASSSSSPSPYSSSTSSASCGTRCLHFAPRCYPVFIHRRRSSRPRWLRRLPFEIRRLQRQLKTIQRESTRKAKRESRESKRRQRPAIWNEWIAMACKTYSCVNAVVPPQEIINKVLDLFNFVCQFQPGTSRKDPSNLEATRTISSSPSRCR